MRRRQSSTRAHGSLAMVAALGLTLAMAARGQQPMDASQASAPDQSSVDSAQMAPSADPPTQVVRLSVAQGNVSIEPASVNQFSPAEMNYPLTTGDRVWTDYGALAELQAGQLAARMGPATDLTVTAMTDTLAQFGLGQGSVRLRTYVLDPGVTTEVDTPNVAVTVLAEGDARIDVDPTGDFTVVTVFSGVVQVDGNGLQQTVGAGQAVRLGGANPVSAQWLVMPTVDNLDEFSKQRDQAYLSAEAAEQNYLNADVVGGGDLQQYGSWLPEQDYGTVWFPASVAVGWQPYCYGRWTWVAPWGWTWIDTEAWGFAPFHYGRWLLFDGRWGWIPGPPVVRPVYAPALVVFVHPGNGVTAWFPLGPNDPYAPWYHASTLYLNRINASNLYNRNVNQVVTVYNTSNRAVYVDPLGGRRQFENRAAGTIAIPQASFAAGKPVRTSLMRLPAQEIAAAPLLPHPMVTPQRTMLVTTAPKALPPRVPRPTLTSHEDQAVHSANLLLQQPTQAQQPAPIERPGGKAAAQQSNEVNQIEYRNVPGEANQQANNQPTPERNNAAPVAEPERPQVQATQPNTPVHVPPPNQQADRQPNQQPNASPNTAASTPSQGKPNPPAPKPVAPRYPGAITLGAQPQSSQQAGQGMAIKGGERPPNPARGTEQLPRAGSVDPSTQMLYEQPKQLYNRAVPPPTRPSFDQQRQAIENTDPGRPLSPQQLDNLRENRPVGQPQMPEAAPHPAPASPPRSEPAPQRSSPPPQQQRH